MKAAHLYLNFRTTIYRTFEWYRVVLRYYTRSLRFFLADMLLASQYVLKNPHRISRDFLKARGEANIYQYGETPLTTLDKIARECRIQSSDVVYELGCGSGRTLFWLASFVKCKAVGIEFVPTFVEKGKRVKNYAGLRRAEIRDEDMLMADLSNASVIYFYGTCMSEEMIERLTEKLEKLPHGTKVISVSYPLTDYSNKFTLSKHFTGRFPWGKAHIFLQYVNQIFFTN